MGIFEPPSISTSDRTVVSIANAFDLGSTEIDPALFQVAREFAFSSETAQDFAYWYQVSQVFSKFDPGDPGSASRRVGVAMAGFEASELACRNSNGRLVDTWSRPQLHFGHWARARRLTAAVLGRFPWESFPRLCAFGPGASSSLRRTASCQQNKWALSTHITPAAIPYYAAFHRWAGLADLPSRLHVVAGNRVTTVPKSYKTDRTIAIEPDWNMFFQKGVGALIRHRLQRYGILHPDAQQYHARLARQGSVDGSLATLDLSAASDSISLALCEALLPEDWFRVILDLRSPSGVFGDKTYTYEKVSSMGNGFTFELETLLFYVLARAVCRKEETRSVTVYGDDIIVPTHRAEAVVDLLGQAGFATNSEKSFITGPFRESCGGHYWNGVDVRPWYVRKHPSSVGDLIVLGNQMLEWSARFPLLRDPLRNAYSVVKRHIPRTLRGPWGHDGCLWSDWDESVPSWNRDTQSYAQLTIQRQHRYSSLSEHSGAYFHKLWTTDGELQASLLAKATTREKVVKTYVDRTAWSLLPVRLA